MHYVSMILKTAVVFCVLIWTGTAGAAIGDVTDGDFDNTGAGLPCCGGLFNVGSPWFQSVASGDDFQDWLFGPGWFQYSQLDSNADGNVFGSSSDTGYIYQDLGTYAGEPGIALSGTSISRDVGNGPVAGGAVFSIYEAPNGTVGADGTFAGDLGGANLVDSQTMTAGTIGAFSLDFNLSGVTAGNQIFFAIQPLSGDDQETFLDSLSVTIIPEPASIVLLGMGGLMVLRRRR